MSKPSIRFDRQEQFRAERNHMLTSLSHVQSDTGAAVAYVYHGDNPDTRSFLSYLQVYAMVLPEKGKAPLLQQVDFFLPDVMLREQQEAVALGFVPVGTIKDHYNDVLGLCHEDDDIEAVIAPFAADSLIVNCYGRLQPVCLSDAQAHAKIWWHGNTPTMTQAKDEMTQRIAFTRNVFDYMEAVYKKFSFAIPGAA